MSRVESNLEQGAVRGKTLVVIAIVVLLLVVGWALLSFGGGRTTDSRTAADNFVALLADGNADETYALLSENFQQTFTQESWGSWVDLAFAEADVQEVSFDEELEIQNPESTYGEGTTPVRYVYSFTVDGQKYNIPFVFLNENSTWKVAEIGAIESVE